MHWSAALKYPAKSASVSTTVDKQTFQLTSFPAEPTWLLPDAPFQNNKLNMIFSNLWKSNQFFDSCSMVWMFRCCTFSVNYASRRWPEVPSSVVRGIHRACSDLDQHLSWTNSSASSWALSRWRFLQLKLWTACFFKPKGNSSMMFHVIPCEVLQLWQAVATSPWSRSLQKLNIQITLHNLQNYIEKK